MNPASPEPTSGVEVPVETAPVTLGQRFKRSLLAGLVVLAPVTLTIFILVQIFLLLDGLFEPAIVRVVGTHVPGVGLVLTLLVVIVLGWLSTNVLGRRLINLVERLMARVPVGRSVYSASKSVLEILSQRQTDAFKRVVMIEYPRKGLFSIAFVTGKTNWSHLHPELEDTRTVFLPTTPNPTSGYLLFVPVSEIIDLPITIEEGVRLVISGGILLPKSLDLSSQPMAPTAAKDRLKE